MSVKVQPDPETMVSGYRPYVLYTLSSNCAGTSSVVRLDGGIRVFVALSTSTVAKRADDDNDDVEDIVFGVTPNADADTAIDKSATADLCISILFLLLWRACTFYCNIL